MIDATIGGSDSNSYVILDEANKYADERGYEVWSTYSEKQKIAALINSAEYIDDTYGVSFVGSRVTDTQNLCFPRNIEVSIEAQSVSSDEIPKRVKYAQIELALAYLDNGMSFFGGVDNAGVKSYSVTAGPVTEMKTFATSGSGFEIFNERARKFLSPFLGRGIKVSRN